MKKNIIKLSLDRNVNYRIEIQGKLDNIWTEWYGKSNFIFRNVRKDLSVTIIKGKFDQAALHSLLRRLYSVGIPIISIICTDIKEKDDKENENE